jgi:hypothetical protein
MHLAPRHLMPLIYSSWTTVERSAPRVEALTRASAVDGTAAVATMASARVRGAISVIMIVSRVIVYRICVHHAMPFTAGLDLGHVGDMAVTSRRGNGA